MISTTRFAENPRIAQTIPPFTHIQMAVELMTSDEINEQNLVYLELIQRNADRLFLIISNEFLKQV